MSLYSGKRIHGYKWKTLPIDENVIARVEQMAEKEEQPIMNKGMPCFEWAPGMQIGEDPVEMEEQRLTIASGNLEIEGQDETAILQPQLEQIQIGPADDDPVVVGDDYDILENTVDIQNEDDGMIVLPEENIVSDEEECVEPEDTDYNHDEDEAGVIIEDEEVAVAALDDVEVTAAGNTRPRRTNAGAGVERLQMDFSGKGYGAKRQFNFVTNGEKSSRGQSTQSKQATYMSIACNVVFT